MLGKIDVRPAPMVFPSPTSLAAVSLAQDASPSHTNPAVQSREGTRMAVLEVVEPSLQRAVDVDDDHFEALPAGALGLALHLPLLRTPPCGDALSFGFRPESACLTRTLTSLTMHARGRTMPARRLPA